MNDSFFTTRSLTKIIKYAMIPVFSLPALGAVASEHTTALELNESSPYLFEDSLTKDIDVNLDKNYLSIESVCLKVIVESGRPNTVGLLETSEPVEDGFSFPIEIVNLQAFTYSVSISDAGETSTISELEEFSICSNMPNNFVDGQSSFGLTFAGDDVTVTSLDLIINGVLNNTNIESEIASESDSIIEADGEALIFNTEVTNLDVLLNSKIFQTWSVITFPNGDLYPVKGPRDLQLQYQEAKTIAQRFYVPAWFDAGEYKVTTYVADKLSGERVTSSFNFIKLDNSEVIGQ